MASPSITNASTLSSITSVSTVVTPAFVIDTSPVMAAAAARLPAFPTIIFAEVRDMSESASQSASASVFSWPMSTLSTVPVTAMLPTTSKTSSGDVSPMPTLPYLK